MALKHTGSVVRDLSYTKILMRLFAILFSIVIAIVFVLSIFITYNFIFQNNNGTVFGGYKVFTILGDSMAPQFKPGDLIIIKSVPIDQIKTGDIVSFYDESIIVTHRVSDIKDASFITKGDYNTSIDEEQIDYSKILGKYIIKIPKGDSILSLSKNPFFIFGIFLLLLVNISFLHKAFSK